MSKSIRNRCPECGNTTLLIGSGGWITCSWLKCKAPSLDEAIFKILNNRDSLQDAFNELYDYAHAHTKSNEWEGGPPTALLKAMHYLKHNKITTTHDPQE